MNQSVVKALEEIRDNMWDRDFEKCSDVQRTFEDIIKALLSEDRLRF